MKFLTSLLFVLFATASLAAPLPVPKELQNQAINVVIPYAAGGGADTWNRIIFKQVSINTGLNFLIVNRPGATGAIGTSAVAVAKPDGLTIMASEGGPIVLSPLMKSPGFTERDKFRTVAITVLTPHGIFVPSNSKYNTIQDLVADIKANPDKVNFGCSSGFCTPTMGRMMDGLGVDLQPIRYNDTIKMLTDVAGGNLTFASADPTGIVQSRGGKIKPLAFSPDHRLKEFPNIPVYKEVVPGLAAEWFQGVWVPAATPDHIINYLNQVIREVIPTPETQDAAHVRGARTMSMNASDSEAFVTRQIQIFKPWIEKYYHPEKQ
jgi:tripartite-type tricarboxylate transporter receptor subunit TctC